MPISQDLSTNPKAPSFPLNAILRLIPEVRAAFATKVGHHCESHILYAMSQDILEAMGLRNEVRGAVHQSIMNFMVGRAPDKLFNADDARRMGIRFAGQIVRLREGRAIVPWGVLSPLDWSVVQIVDMMPGVRHYRGRDTSGKIVKMHGLAGPLSGELFDWFFPIASSRPLAIKLGFSRFSRGKYPKESDREMCQLRLAVQAEAKDKKPLIRATDCPSVVVAYNREVMAKRLRRDFDCPFSYHHKCYQCPHGANECPASVRYSPLELKLCSECKCEEHHPTESWAAGVCVKCVNKRRNQA